MHSGTMKVCTYMGAVAGTLMFVGIWPLAQMFPPLDPAMPPDPRRPVFPARARFAALGLLAGAIVAGFVLLGFASRRRPA